jgi:adenine/guanine phosphoribosyltransferase-like PRPP-binding protein
MEKINKNGVLIAAAVGAAAGILFYLARRVNKSRILNAIAEEGYETAHEVLFPHKKQLGDKLHYGPVIPS